MIWYKLIKTIKSVVRLLHTSWYLWKLFKENIFLICICTLYLEAIYFKGGKLINKVFRIKIMNYESNSTLSYE